MRIALLAALIGASLLPTAHAQDGGDAADPDKADGTWSGKGELGFAAATGNTDSQTFVADLGIAREDDTWKASAGASFLYGKSDDIETAYRYELFATGGYRLGEKSYLFGNMRNERDHFASDEYAWVVSGGYGYEAIKSEDTTLVFEIGPGYRWSKVQDLRIHNNEAILRGFADFKHQFNENTALYDTFLVEAGQANTFLKNELGLEVKMTAALALKAALEVRYNTDVEPGLYNTDTLTTVNVVYAF